MAFTFVFMIFLYGLFCIPGYVLTGISLYAIANRRGIEQPWRAWVPGMNLWLIGCISDQYQAIVRGKQKNKRTALLFLIFALLIAFCAMHIMAPSGTAASETMLPFLLIFVPAWCASAALIVITFMALYDLYVSCDPKNAVLYLVLSIVVSVTMPVFLFLCRKKDLGFPL